LRRGHFCGNGGPPIVHNLRYRHIHDLSHRKLRELPRRKHCLSNRKRLLHAMSGRNVRCRGRKCLHFMSGRNVIWCWCRRLLAVCCGLLLPCRNDCAAILPRRYFLPYSRKLSVPHLPCRNIQYIRLWYLQCMPSWLLRLGWFDVLQHVSCGPVRDCRRIAGIYYNSCPSLAYT
jgi:hypothetical protein